MDHILRNTWLGDNIGETGKEGRTKKEGKIQAMKVNIGKP